MATEGTKYVRARRLWLKRYFKRYHDRVYPGHPHHNTFISQLDALERVTSNSSLSTWDSISEAINTLDFSGLNELDRIFKTLKSNKQ